jgi:hypothetical protein
MNHVKEASKGTGAFHIWPQWGKTLVQYCVAGLSGWVSASTLDSSFRLNSSTLSRDASPRPIVEATQTPVRPRHAEHVCHVCGRTSESTICEGCAERIRIEALARKKHEENGGAWTHWE